MLDLVTDGFPEDPLLDMALSEALLRQVGAGQRGPTLRIFRPGPTLAFGRLDARARGFRAACDLARDRGFVPVVRSAGGHAVAYDQDSLVVEHVAFEHGAIAGLEPRFRDQSQRVVEALARVGAEARVGELPGEYCPGAYSVNVGGRSKVAGIAQRVIKDAARTSAVIVVGGGRRIPAVIQAVYAALDIPVDPATVGVLEDAQPGVGVADVERAARDAYAASHELRDQQLDAGLEAEARALLSRHRP